MAITSAGVDRSDRGKPAGRTFSLEPFTLRAVQSTRSQMLMTGFNSGALVDPVSLESGMHNQMKHVPVLFHGSAFEG
jgi:hypothetical protein